MDLLELLLVILGGLVGDDDLPRVFGYDLEVGHAQAFLAPINHLPDHSQRYLKVVGVDLDLVSEFLLRAVSEI